jgi:hypothetical protein
MGSRTLNVETLFESDQRVITNGTQLGAGADVFRDKDGGDLRFRSLIGGDNVTITQQDDTVTIAATPGGGAESLNDLSDVTIDTPADNHGLFRSDGQWRNRTPAQIRTHINVLEAGTGGSQARTNDQNDTRFVERSGDSMTGDLLLGSEALWTSGHEGRMRTSANLFIISAGSGGAPASAEMRINANDGGATVTLMDACRIYAGLTDIRGGARVGVGTTIHGILSATALRTEVANVASGSFTSVSVTVSGAAVGDAVFASPDASTVNLSHCNARVTAANTVSVRYINHTGSPQTLPEHNMRVWVFKHS